MIGKRRRGRRAGRRAWRPRPGRRQRMERARRAGGSRRAGADHRRRRQLPEGRARALICPRNRSIRCDRSPADPPPDACRAWRQRRDDPGRRLRAHRRRCARVPAAPVARCGRVGRRAGQRAARTRSPRICSACRPRARPRSASTRARARRCASQLSDRSAAGQAAHRGDARAPTSRGPKRIDTAGLSFATRTSVEVVRSAYRTALEGFALPYGDVAVGGWRNTPYVVIQNVGAYLDVPRFLDSDHTVETAADAEAYLVAPRQPIRRSSTARPSGCSAAARPRA